MACNSEVGCFNFPIMPSVLDFYWLWQWSCKDETAKHLDGSLLWGCKSGIKLYIRPIAKIVVTLLLHGIVAQYLH